jgi:oxepin-CoA hydrolase/3-oxo-5,6-dehydrosuberyl-CoA semialdehyde dehydrogenase
VIIGWEARPEHHILAAMERLGSFLQGEWTAGASAGVLVNPATEEPLAEVSVGPASLGPALAWGRREGGAALARMTFAERGEILRALSRAVHAQRDALIAVAVANGGNTRGDAKFDIDGASGTFAHYADLGAALGSTHVWLDGDAVQLGRSPRFFGQHVRVPRPGIAVLINAFNFPAWGIAEKAACAWLAGMPLLAKPATATALVAHRFTQVLLGAGVLPVGALQLLTGPPGDLLEELGGHDVLAFTGSSTTARALRAHPRVVAESVRVNVEADSLNAAVLGPDVEPGSPTWDLFVADVTRDLTQKTGQKCTAIRRVFVPAARAGAVEEALAERLHAVRVGDPARDDVTMGPVASARQRDDVRAGIARLAGEARVVVGGDGGVAEPLGVPAGKGFFVAPVLARVDDGHAAHALHEHEIFGPVATVASARDAADAAALVARGGGGLVASVYSDERAFLAALVPPLAARHGRIYVGSAKLAGQAPGPGTALPQLLHGGPGRAGGGEELGGLRGVALYTQTCALEGDKALLEAITKP